MSVKDVRRVAIQENEHHPYQTEGADHPASGSTPGTHPSIQPSDAGTNALLDAPEPEVLDWMFGGLSTEVDQAQMQSGRERLGLVREPEAFERLSLTLGGRQRGQAEIGTATEGYSGLPDDAFYMLYVGDDADSFHWAQFVWAEAFGATQQGEWRNLGGERLTATSAGTYLLTPGGSLQQPGAPKNAEQVALDMGMERWKDDEGTQQPSVVGAIDSPGSKRGDLEAMLKKYDLAEIKLRQHYEIFLVKKGRRVQSHSRVTMDWATQRQPAEGEGLPAVPPVEISATDLGSADSLPEPFLSVFQKYSPELSRKL